jgi:GTPase SAR1 family protein
MPDLDTMIHMNLGSYYQSCAFVLFTYDITQEESLLNIKDHVEHMTVMCKNPFLIRVLVGCKSDEGDKRRVSSEQAGEVAKELGLNLHFEVSAKTGHNLENMFQKIYSMIADFLLKKAWPKLDSRGKPTNIEKYGVQIMPMPLVDYLAEK